MVDPGRNPKLYYDFAEAHAAQIVAVIETHPHADFVSSHLEFHKNEGATIYVSKLVGATYPGFFVEYLQFLGQIPACFA